MRRAFGGIRVVAAGVIIAAIVAQLLYSLSFDLPSVPVFLVNFFSFFTILSNAIAAIALLVGAWYCFTVPVDPPWFNLVLACIVTYMATTGVVYNLLLRQVSLDQASTLPWSNEVLHLIAPIYMVLVWVFAPGKRPIAWSQLWIVAIFPLAWAGYTMIRGPIAGWYPYPFLDPAQPGGYGAVAVYVLGIAGFIVVMGALVIWLSKLSRRSAAVRA